MKAYFVHPQGICESEQIGDGTRIWAFAHVLPGARIGRDCNICDGVFIENDVVVGDRVTVKCGVQLWDGVQIEDDVFIGPNATFTNDSFPRSKKYPERFEPTRIARGASIGANATILPGTTVGEWALVGAGAVVTRSVPANAIITGNPARIVGYVDAQRNVPALQEFQNAERSFAQSAVAGVRVVDTPLFLDMRGTLTAAEIPSDIPFEPKRYFVVFDVPSSEVRGEHAHRECHQFLVCIRGSVLVVVDDGTNREEFRLDAPRRGLYIPPLVWAIQYQYSPDAMLLVLASHPYRADDYIRDYVEYLTIVRAKR